MVKFYFWGGGNFSSLHILRPHKSEYIYILNILPELSDQITYQYHSYLNDNDGQVSFRE